MTKTKLTKYQAKISRTGVNAALNKKFVLLLDVVEVLEDGSKVLFREHLWVPYTDTISKVIMSPTNKVLTGRKIEFKSRPTTYMAITTENLKCLSKIKFISLID